MHASNWKKKTTDKKNKNNFINVLEDEFTLNIG